jgi:hypothetical protein
MADEGDIGSCTHNVETGHLLFSANNHVAAQSSKPSRGNWHPQAGQTREIDYLSKGPIKRSFSKLKTFTLSQWRKRKREYGCSLKIPLSSCVSRVCSGGQLVLLEEVESRW